MTLTDNHRHPVHRVRPGATTPTRPRSPSARRRPSTPSCCGRRHQRRADPPVRACSRHHHRRGRATSPPSPGRGATDLVDTTGRRGRASADALRRTGRQVLGDARQARIDHRQPCRDGRRRDSAATSKVVGDRADRVGDRVEDAAERRRRRVVKAADTAVAEIGQHRRQPSVRVLRQLDEGRALRAGPGARHRRSLEHDQEAARRCAAQRLTHPPDTPTHAPHRRCTRSVRVHRAVRGCATGWGHGPVARVAPRGSRSPGSRGVGPAKAKALASFGIRNVFDLLTHYPRRYIDRTKEAQIRDLELGETASVLARVTEIASRRVKGGRVDGHGHGARRVGRRCGSASSTRRGASSSWRPGTEAVFFGKLEDFRGRRQMTNPVVDLIGDRTGKVVPVYPQSEKVRLTSWDLGRVGSRRRCAGPASSTTRCPSVLLDRHDLVDRTTAFHGIHVPESDGEHTASPGSAWSSTSCSGCSSRWCCASASSRPPRRASPTTPTGRLVRPLPRASCPFPLTGAQERTIAEIAADLARPVPMHRLLQGDVGCGQDAGGGLGACSWPSRAGTRAR